MDQSELAKIETLFHALIDIPPGPEREAAALRLSGDDARLARRALDLVDSDEQAEAANDAARVSSEPATYGSGAMDRAESFIPTAHFGAYRAVELLAQGGMSSVYRAERADGVFDQVVALKVMAAYLAGPEFLRRFDTERQLLAALNHNNITRILDGGVSSAGDPFLITEFVQGETIDCYCDQRKLSLEGRLRIFLQVCDAVDHAHRNLIVHRDLKPGNILVNAEGIVKLLDFGTASMMAARSDVTLTKMHMLTPRYASPEQLRGERVSTATDVFSLGIVLYELVTGAWPFGDPASVVTALNRTIGDVTAKSPATVVTAESAELRSLSLQNLAGALRGDLSAIVLKALESDPARRYESALAFTADIRSFLDGRPVLARPQTSRYRASKFFRRRWIPVTAAAAFVLGLLGSTLVAIHQAKTARAEARKAEKVSLFLNDMLSASWSKLFEPRKFTVAQMLDAAQPQLEKSWKDDPLVEATLRSSLGSSYLALQSFDQAKVQLEKALATFRSLGNRVEEVKTIFMLGVLCDNTGQLEQSVAYYRSGLEKADRLSRDVPNLTVFRLKRNLANDLANYFNRELDDARRLIAEALTIAARDPSIPKFDLTQALSWQAGMLMEQGKNEEAESVLLRALEIGRKDEDWRSAIDPLSYMVVLNGRKRNYAGARDYAGEQYRFVRDHLGPDHNATTGAEITWARYRAETGQLDEAVLQVDEAMKILQKNYPPLSANLWAPLSGAAGVLNRAGRFKEAEAYARDQIAICDAMHLAEADARRADSLSRLGDALRGQHRYREAIEALERSARDYEQSGTIWSKRAAQIQSTIKEMQTQAK